MRVNGSRRAASNRGFTYLGVLFLVALLSTTAAMASVVWSVVQQRENERELVFVGGQFQAAIEHYRQRSNGAAKPYPPSLQELLRDSRSAALQRDLRQIYFDPMTGSAQWGLIRSPDGGIVGVHSLSDRAPLQRSFVARGVSFPRATSYRDWRFIAPSAVELARATPPLPASRSVPAAPRERPTPARGVAEPPVIAPLDELPTMAVPRPSQQDYRSRTPEACARIAAYDNQICSQQAARLGEEAGAECQDSAVERTIACSLDPSSPLPTLITRDQ